MKQQRKGQGRSPGVSRTPEIEVPRLESLKQINLNAAGLDVGDREIYVCVPEGRAEKSVRVFPTFTADLNALTWIIHEKCKRSKKKSLKRFRIKLLQTFSVSIVP